MGSRTADTMTEIDLIRMRLDGTLRQLEERMPPVVQIGKRALAISGGTLGGGIAVAILKRALRRKPKAKAGRGMPPVITVRSGIGFPAAIGIAAIWAGVRIFEAKQRAAATSEQRASLSVVPGRQRA